MTDITEITRRALENRQPTPPTKEIITALAREKLARKMMGGKDALTYAQGIADKWVDDALNGDDKKLAMLLERVEGKVPQAVVGADGGDLVIQIVKYSAHDLTEPLEAKAISGPSVDGVARRN